jgi:hypothetical protein
MEDELQNIILPGSILVGTEDKVRMIRKAEFIVSKIPQAKLVYIQNAGIHHQLKNQSNIIPLGVLRRFEDYIREFRQ